MIFRLRILFSCCDFRACRRFGCVFFGYGFCNCGFFGNGFFNWDFFCFGCFLFCVDTKKGEACAAECADKEAGDRVDTDDGCGVIPRCHNHVAYGRDHRRAVGHDHIGCHFRERIVRNGEEGDGEQEQGRDDHCDADEKKRAAEAPREERRDQKEDEKKGENGKIDLGVLKDGENIGEDRKRGFCFGGVVICGNAREGHCGQNGERTRIFDRGDRFRAIGCGEKFREYAVKECIDLFADLSEYGEDEIGIRSAVRGNFKFGFFRDGCGNLVNIVICELALCDDILNLCVEGFGVFRKHIFDAFGEGNFGIFLFKNSHCVFCYDVADGILYRRHIQNVVNESFGESKEIVFGCRRGAIFVLFGGSDVAFELANVAFRSADIAFRAADIAFGRTGIAAGRIFDISRLIGGIAEGALEHICDRAREACGNLCANVFVGNDRFGDVGDGVFGYGARRAEDEHRAEKRDHKDDDQKRA